MNGSRWKDVSLLPAGVGVLFTLLVLLAVLQYRWMGEVGEAERARLNASARTRAEHLCQDFDRELTRAFLWLQVDAESLGSRDWKRYAARYARWAEGAEHPKLVRDVFVVERVPGDQARLSRFDPSAGTFGPAAWPEDLSGVKRRIEAFPQGRLESRGGLGGFVVEDVPALLAPAPAFDSRAAPGREAFGGFRIAGLTVVVLDAGQIRNEILPSLASRHFGGAGGLDYDLRVSSRRDTAKVVYSSNPTAPSRAEDVSAGLFELRFDEMSAEDLAWLAPMRRGGPSGPFPPRGPDAGRWHLAATHRFGSVDDVVAAARRRNLALGFGILVLLGGSVVLIAVATLRVRRLAARQMEFVAGVSHELRTPVAVICAAGENLADGLIQAPQQVRRYGATVRDEGRRLAEMVEQVLEFAGTYSGRRTYRFQPLSVGDLVAEARARSSARAADLGFEVECTVASGLPEVRGDAIALRQVLENLLENAMKYGMAGRWIGIRVEPAPLNGRPAVRIAIEDHGGGIPSAELRQIFEPFYRGRAAQEGEERGFGLGLSLVKRVVEAHGGTVGALSEPGRGSTFSLVLPAASPAPQAAEPEERADGITHSAG